MSASRVGESLIAARRRRISGLHSGIFCLGDAIDTGYKFVPAAKLRSEDSAALARQTIVTAAALSAFFDPASMQPAAAFQAVEQRAKRNHMKKNSAARAFLYKFSDFVTLARTALHAGNE